MTVKKKPSRRRAITAIIVTVISGVAGGLMVTLAFRIPSAWIVFVLLALAFFAVAATLQIRGKIAEIEDIAAHEKLKQKISDDAMPFFTTATGMTFEPLEARYGYIKPVALQAVMLLLSLVDVERSRANVYILEIDGSVSQLRSLAHRGRGKAPDPFRSDTARGEKAIEFLEGGKLSYYADLEKNAPEDFDVSEHEYRTFISMPIFAEGPFRTYGMLTLDAPVANSFTKADQALVEAVAEMMTIPFAVALNRPLSEENISDPPPELELPYSPKKK